MSEQDKQREIEQLANEPFAYPIYEEKQTNKTTGGVWVSCRERWPSHSNANGPCREVVMRELTGKYWVEFYDDVRDEEGHWLDTTVEIVTKAEHDAAIAKLQKENEELRARIEELQKRLIMSEIKPNYLAVDVITGKRMCEEENGTNGD